MNPELKCNDCNLEVKKEYYLEKYEICIDCYKLQLQEKINKCSSKHSMLSLKSLRLTQEMNYQGAKQQHLRIKLELLSK